MSDSLPLTHEQWLAVKPPFHIAKISHTGWSKLDWEIATKYAASQSSGWVYSDQDVQKNSCRFIFEREDDLVLFRIWVTDADLDNGSVP